MRELAPLMALALALVLMGCQGAPTKNAERLRIGHAADPAEIRRLDIDVSPTGEGLPIGGGTPIAGAAVYRQQCAMCHGQGIAIEATRWPYATTIFDYIRRAMPPNAKQHLTVNEVYEVTAYLLAQSGALRENDFLSNENLSHIISPRINDFFGQP